MSEQQHYYSDKEAKELICEIGRRVYHKNFVAANDGNISVKVGSNTIWTTPTGVSKGFMTPEMMVKMDLSGNVLEGTMKPSSEVKMHLRVYKENQEVNAVVHAHPPVATSFAIAGISLDQPISPEAIVLLGRVPVATYATPGTQEVPDSIAPYCKDHNAVLLANHGALTWGRELMEAYFRMESLEHYALMTMYSNHIIKKANELSPAQISDLIDIRGKMGIKTGGVPVNTTQENTEISEELIASIVKNVVHELNLKELK
ncbi:MULTISPECIES: class II aldolase/adducin family protein [unclassified Bacillus (in: firmicutes)]|uniref:class II aldolase/adducin family protein n=1 Tax=unclassified Bacillus (in: firmicutes) TaxID=185979 RepID=UPI0008ED1F83|nr:MULTISPECIES: class II aldolase/adducin family protein [unclassified Bacillus (in: firmicutes)]SFB07872.1 L-fuculose-phosphate aldolase [Bacillus sp. UNCCL13]SFQ87190.1 L-fuculose-phosphate aldolase [Bacillus sp. cl95]